MQNEITILKKENKNRSFTQFSSNTIVHTLFIKSNYYLSYTFCLNQQFSANFTLTFSIIEFLQNWIDREGEKILLKNVRKE